GRPRTRRGPSRRAPVPDVLRDRNRGAGVAESQANRLNPVCRPCAGVFGRRGRDGDALALVGVFAKQIDNAYRGGENMSITPEQRTYARLAGILFLAKLVLEGGGDGVTILAHGGESFAETARFAAENALLWRFALLNVGLAWIVVGIQAHALYVVLEPVNKRLAQLALVLRLGACS